MSLPTKSIPLFHRAADLLGRIPPAITWAVASLAWAGALFGLAGRALLQPDRATNTARYLRAGRDWLAGENLYIYTPNKGFVYSPLCAICYAATTWLPEVVANVFWIFISGVLLLGGLWAMLNKGPFRSIPQHLQPLVYLLVFPLALGNIDSAQANPIVIGSVMLAISAAYCAKWSWAAAALGLAVFWKVYPLAVGLLLVLTAPGKFSWRLVLMLLIGAFLPFAFQNPAYVISQYHLWYDTRTSDNRLEYSLDVAPLDLWFVLVRFAGLPIDPLFYRILQLAAAVAIAAVVAWGTWKKWASDRLMGALFCLVCVWMTLLGPASELHAYLLLGPAVCLSLAATMTGLSRPIERGLILATYILLLLAILRVGFIPKYKELWILTLQPLAAVLFLMFAVLRYLRPSVQTGRIAG
ncbi:MAG: hypothetical protein Fur0032_18210 [Terrimicrobiaceae bacterium]